MKVVVEYSLDNNLRNEITKVKNLILEILKNSEIYLFGSIAKGRYKKDPQRYIHKI